MVTRLKFISGFSKALSPGFLIIVWVCILFGTNVWAQTKVASEVSMSGGLFLGFSGREILDKNAVGGGSSISFGASDGIEIYRIGLMKSYFPDFDLRIAVNKYTFRNLSYGSISSGFTYFPIRFYDDKTRILLAFHAEYEHSFEKVRQDSQTLDDIQSYQLRGSVFFGAHNSDRSSVFLPYLTYGTVNTSNISDKTYDVLGFGLMLASKIGKSDTFFVFSVGAMLYGENVMYGVKFGYALEKDYMTASHLK
jgi:hypothetical protein